MIQIPVRISGPVARNTVGELNCSSRKAVTAQSLQELNRRPKAGSRPAEPAPQPARPAAKAAEAPRPRRPMPALLNPIQKGQKLSLEPAPTGQLHVCLGWDEKNPACDVDVSAFLLGPQGKVPGDDWFVFYGQTDSPDKSVRFFSESAQDRQYISIDLSRLDPRVEKIVFVLTINDALANGLHFGMLQDAYIRILDAASRREYVSFRMTDYYSNVISMMIGELYLYKGSWKFNAIGNGVARDLAGLCQLYGVQVI